ncbi:MAG: transcriptional regulator [Thermoproteota archaeon]|nr:MAG: transcriptional regulator [Candidatus Korarchaeota archaeon]RLG54057.1 MAG: transcriptional regulator [Candidatus Korarchaeota archaeon]
MSSIEVLRDYVARKIIGDIVMSDSPGKAMKRWREYFGIQQSKLAEQLEISPSVISDYESGRRKSPGTYVLKRFVNALIEADLKSGGHVTRLLAKTLTPVPLPSSVIDMKEFSHPVKISKLVDAISGEVYSCKDSLDEHIYGYTIIDALKAIKELSGQDFYNIFGVTTQRALVFTNARQTGGRTLAVAIKVFNIKPGALVVHGSSRADDLAIELTELMGVPLVISRLSSVAELVNALRKLLVT